ncbi:MAG: hypothetical protein QQW96_03670 [Tychonema bourrellyi B0820]|nr:hypothetical protein [Tychonema bourrellyi]MDQ2096727.1 hypothetical protein [Tychonema bourrellyi B0820]
MILPKIGLIGAIGAIEVTIERGHGSAVSLRYRLVFVAVLWRIAGSNR